MIITKEFIDFMDKADSDIQASVYNFVIYTLCTLKLKDRIKSAIEIILGKKYCIYISKNQKVEK